MSELWWDKKTAIAGETHMVTGLLGEQPRLLPANRKSVESEIRRRIASYTTEWTNLSPEDAGIAFIRLFSEQIESVLERLNRLPEKAIVEFLESAGIEPLAATAAKGLLEFTVSDDAPESIVVPAGFQVGAKAADGSGDLVIFETERTMYAAPLTVAELHIQRGSQFQDVAEVEAFLPFGRQPAIGDSLWIGLAGTVVPGPTLTVSIRIVAPLRSPPPVSAGGVMPLPPIPPPLLGWDVLDGGTLRPADVVIDETAGLTTSGIVELELPRTWAIGRPADLGDEKKLRWLRLRFESGQYLAPPQLSRPVLNVVRAIAARTVRDEVLEPVSNSSGRRWRLSQTPILPGSLILEVDEGDILTAPVSDQETIGAAEDGVELTARQWTEVPGLGASGPEDRVYTLDSRTGEVLFGNGKTGASVPPGFRHIRALSYQVGGGRAGAVAIGAASTLISAVPFLSEVTNSLPAGGGRNLETNDEVIGRGPQEFRARGHAVTVADYELMALRTQGAQVERAHAVSGHHPSFPGLPIPGVVGVFVVPPDTETGQPPTPDQEALRAVAEFLSEKAAPAGIDVVAAAPRYQEIRSEVGVLINPEADAGSIVRVISQTLNRYFHPLVGGADGRGWPFGGIIRYPAVLRLISEVEGVRAVPRLNFSVDGYDVPACRDFPIADHGLLWPQGHQVILMEEEVEV